MLTPSLNTVMTRLLIVAAVLVALMFIASATFAQEGPIEFDENGTDAVITFTSTDPEGAGIDWDVTGTDADDFYIDAAGSLMFRSPPDYENPTDRADNRGTPDVAEDDFDAEMNTYQITVRATEQETSGSDPRALSTTADYTIQVVDVNEAGSITLNRIQPEVGTPITARLSDPDGTRGADPVGSPTAITWQWYVSKVTNPVVTFDSHWETVGTDPAANTDVTTSTYPPAGDRVTDTTSVAADEGKYLRAVATYMDRHGASRTARVMSENPVRAEVTSDSDEVENPTNGSPGFSSTGVYTRSIVESAGKYSPVGAPVTAIDPNSNDTLTYELDNDTDATNAVAMVDDTTNNFASDVSFFSIDDETGQISLRKGLSFEATDGRDYDDTDPSDTAGTYKFYVRATDPSGETAEVEVTVTATDANDAPVIKGSVAADTATQEFGPRPVAPAELTVNETADGTFTGGPDMINRSLPGVSRNVFTADDEDARRTATWSITGVDADVFELTSSSPDPTTGLRGPGEPIALRFKIDPDFENPLDDNLDSVYKVTLVVTDNGGLTDERPLTIFVQNVQEGGEAELDESQPTIGAAITASVNDPDNGVAVVTWRWERATSTTPTAWEVINGATTATYTPVKGKDHDDEGYYLRAIATYTDIMSHLDMPETLLVDERTQNADTATPPAPTAKNPETPADNLYRVVVVSANAVRVPPETPEEETNPQFAMSPYELSVSENAERGSLVGYPVAVETEAGKSFNYTLEDSITGDEVYFVIATTTGQVRVAAVDFPDPVPASRFDDEPENATSTDATLDYEGKNTFDLIVTATDTSNDSRQATAAVTVTLDNINERPYFDKASRDVAATTIMYSEVRTNPVAPLIAAAEPDGGELVWVLTGDDAEDFEIDNIADLDDGKDRIALRFKSKPNYEALKGSATTTVAGDTYNVTVRATEQDPIGMGPPVSLGEELAVTVQVTDHNEPGEVEVRWLQPEVGTDISASLSDPDAGVTGQNWTWYRSKAANPNPVTDPSDTAAIALEWELTADTDNNDEYTPVAADEGKFLLARVVYNDTPGGAGTENQNSAVGRSVNAVRADVSNDMNNSPDFNASEIARMIPEDTAVGDPVGDVVDVDRNEDGDTLTYEIVRVDVDGGTVASETEVGDPGNNAVVAVDLPYFSIDKATGQLRVARKLSAEETDGRTYTGTGATSTPGEYQVVVRATDPSGEPNDENRDDIVVKITATDVEEAPWISEGAAELTVCEVNSDDDSFVGLGYNLENCAAVAVDGSMTNNDNRYRRTEEDSVDRAIWPEPVRGDDGHLFEYSTPGDGIGRKLHFKQANLPDYEAPADANSDNVYEVKIRVLDSEGLSGEKDVRITVTNVDEAGKVTLAPDQPDDGMPVIATLTDPDMVLSVTNWEWATTTDSTLTAFPEASIVPDANMSQYMGQVGEFLWVRVMYRDAQSVTDDPVTVHDERNDDPAAAADTAPVDTFDTDRVATSSTANAVQPDPDPDNGDGGGSSGVVPFSIDVYENVPSTGYVGDPILNLGDRDTIGGPDGATFVFAEDNDATGSTYYDGTTAADDDFGLLDPDGDTGTDNDKAGQLALMPVTHLDYESKDTYVVEITTPVTSPVEQSVYRVTINVMDVNEAPSAPIELKGLPPTLNTEPMFLDANGDVATSTTRSVAENTSAGTAIGGPVMATDSDRGDQETLVYTLGGADMASFAFDSATGQLSTSAPLDFETKSEFMVTVTATDDNEASSMIYVTISVTDVSLGVSGDSYDADSDELIDATEVLQAVRDFFDEVISGPEVLEVVRLYFENVGS